MMTRDKLRQLKKQLKALSPVDTNEAQIMHALIDSNLEALDQLEGGKTTQQLRAELTERERQLGLALRDLEVTIRTEGASTAKQLYTIEQIKAMLRAKGPKWHREWSHYQPRIEEEFSDV